MDTNKQTSKNTPPFFLRIKASLIDYIIILAWMGIITIISYAIAHVNKGHPNYLGSFGPIGTQIIAFLELTFPVGLYFFISESSSHHGSIGKRITGIKVLTKDGKAPSKTQIFIRTVIKLLPWEIAHTFIWQLQYVFYQNGYDTNVPLWIFAGLLFSTILLSTFVAVTVIRNDSRAPHDLFAQTQVASSN